MSQRTPEGDQHGYVGQIIDPDWSPDGKTADPYHPPVPEGMTAMPEPGIYFGMDDEDYHRVFAVSSSGIKKLVASSMEYWANGPMNPDYEERQSPFLDYGKAAHCLVLEGPEEFAKRYAVELDPSQYENVLVSTDEIKNAIRKFTTLAPVKPAPGGKQPLVDQLAALGAEHAQPVNLDGTMTDLKNRIRDFDEEQPVKPASRIVIDSEAEPVETRTAQKEDWIAQLLELKPDAQIWDDMVARHLAANESARMITPKQDRQVRIAAHMIEQHPDAGPMLKGGYAEVSIFWYCPVTGAPCKARLDYLKLRAILDLKTYTNTNGVPVDEAINQAIARYRYRFQHVFYDEAVMAARQLVRDKGSAVVNIAEPHWWEHGCPDQQLEWIEGTEKEIFEWCERWAKITDPPKFIFIFQQSGIAPITRVKGMPRHGTFSVFASRTQELKRKWLECSQQYGNLPWLDIEPMSEVDDDQVPMWEMNV